MIPPFAIFADNQFFLSGLRLGKNLPDKLNVELHIVKPLFPQDLFHLLEHFRPDHVSVRVFRRLRQHFKGVLPGLPELIVQQPLNAEALHSQRMQEFPIPSRILKPQQIFVPAQQSNSAGKGVLVIRFRRMERQPVRQAVAD